MNNKFDKWRKEAPLYQDALLQKIEATGCSVLEVEYKCVAFAFPSAKLHETHFEYPRIAEYQLKEWAIAHGWAALEATEHAPENDKSSFPIRFTKI